MFEHRLAVALGKTIAEVEQMSATELTAWAAFEILQPFPVTRIEIGLASIQCLIANMFRDSKSNPSPFTVDDFIPVFTEEEAEIKQQKRVARKTSAIFDVLQSVADKKKRQKEDYR